MDAAARTLLVILHLRVRIVVPASLKKLGYVAGGRNCAKVGGARGSVVRFGRVGIERAQIVREATEGDFGLFDELPPVRRAVRQASQHNGSSIREVIEPPILEEGIELDEEINDEEEESADESEAASRREEEEEEAEDDDNETSMLAGILGAQPPRNAGGYRPCRRERDELVTRRFDQFVTHYVHIGDLGLMERFSGSINTSMASARMMRYYFGRKYLGDSCVKSYTFMMNT